MNGYELSKGWFDFAFENPEKINPAHSAIYFFAIEHCNRMGWKTKFGFPSQMAMDAVGIRKHDTYIRYFNDLCEWGFFKMIERSKNQYSANIISLGYAIPKNGEALQKAIRKHGGKQTESTGVSTGESVGYIDKPLTLELNNIETRNVKGVTAPPPHPLIVWIAKNAPRVQQLKQPLTNDEAQRIMDDLAIDSENKKQRLRDLLISMENYKPLLTKSVSANLTIRKWWKSELERTGEVAKATVTPIKMNTETYSR